MHVTPVPARPPGRHRGRGTAVPVVVPIAALFLTVTFALAGRAFDVRSGPPAARGDTAAASSESPAPTRPARPTPSSRADDARPAAPTTAYRLSVRTVADLSEGGVGGTIGGLVALAGSFTLDPRARDCPGRQSLSENFCERTGILASSARPLLAVDDNGMDPEAVRLTVAFPSLPVRVPIGVPLPTMVIWASAVEGAIEPVPVVVVGRFEASPRAGCAAGDDACAPDFVLERVAWVAGEWSETLVVRSASIPVDAVPAADRAAQVIATREVDRDEPILSRALLTMDDLRRVDRTAAEAIPVAVDGPVWYVRSVARPSTPAGPRGIAWAAIDQRTGLVLASGTSGSR